MERENLQIVGVKEEAKSARTPGRPVFNDLLKRIERGEADGIVAWHPDRLARNPGKQEPMITMGQFEQAQVMLGNNGRARPKEHVFAYSGLMKCGFCGCSITVEEKINRYGSRYVYYRCTHKKRALGCREKSLEESQLEEQILDFLKTIFLNQQEVNQLRTIVEEERTKECQTEGVVAESIGKALESCTRNLDNLSLVSLIVRKFFRSARWEDLRTIQVSRTQTASPEALTRKCNTVQ